MALSYSVDKVDENGREMLTLKPKQVTSMEELTSPDKKPIGEIAFSCGFTDATYINRCFKKEYGMTPTEYISCLKKE